MIGSLTGRVISIGSTEILMNVNGVGYEVQVASKTIASMPNSNENITIYTHFVVREDNQALFGFIDLHERDLFRKIIKISGVGPKLGLAILDTFSCQDLIACILNKDIKLFSTVPGVGPKKAERIVLELYNMLDSTEQLSTYLEKMKSNSATIGMDVSEATDGLINLGFKPRDVRYAVARVTEEQNIGCEDIIRQALQLLSNDNKVES